MELSARKEPPFSTRPQEATPRVCEKRSPCVAKRLHEPPGNDPHLPPCPTSNAAEPRRWVRCSHRAPRTRQAGSHVTVTLVLQPHSTTTQLTWPRRAADPPIFPCGKTVIPLCLEGLGSRCRLQTERVGTRGPRWLWEVAVVPSRLILDTQPAWVWGPAAWLNAPPCPAAAGRVHAGPETTCS